MDLTKVTFTIGASASGKTTWAYQQYDRIAHGQCAILCRDDIRHGIAYERLQDKGYDSSLTVTNLWKVWNWKWEKEVTERWWYAFDKLAKDKCQWIICADTNLNPDRLEQMKQRMRDEYAITDFEDIRFDVPIEELWKRDAARPDGVGHDVIMRQWMQLQDQVNFGEKYQPNPFSVKAIMVDIDGTLAHMVDRGPFDWHKVGQDDLNPVAYHIVRGYYQQGYEIIVMSGRDSVCRQETENWLVKHNVPYSKMFMREAGDQRKDSIVKNELFWQHVAPYYDIECVIDDRPQVVRQWLTIGLKTVTLGNPWIEF